VLVISVKKWGDLLFHNCVCVSQLPEAIFQQVNENFYRTTFYELCSRYLSSWLAFTVESSYPQGKSDLEFIGKFGILHITSKVVDTFV